MSIEVYKLKMYHLFSSLLLKLSFISASSPYKMYWGEEGTVWPVKEIVQTRMNLVEFEKSKFPLHLTSNNEYMNFIFQEEIGPNFWLTWFTFKGARGFSNWVLIIDFSPTRNLQQIWFKGELIFMLLGGFCSPSRKEKKQSAEEEAISRKNVYFFFFQFLFYVILEGKDLLRGEVMLCH